MAAAATRGTDMGSRLASSWEQSERHLFLAARLKRVENQSWSEGRKASFITMNSLMAAWGVVGGSGEAAEEQSR